MESKNPLSGANVDYYMINKMKTKYKWRNLCPISPKCRCPTLSLGQLNTVGDMKTKYKWRNLCPISPKCRCSTLSLGQLNTVGDMNIWHVCCSTEGTSVNLSIKIL